MKVKTLVVIITLFILVLFGILVVRGRKIREGETPRQPSIEETETTTYLVRLRKGCAFSLDKEFHELFSTPRFRFVSVELTPNEKKSLAQDRCVVRISNMAQAKANFEKLPLEIKEAAKEKLKKYYLAKSLLKRDLVDRKKLLEILRREQPTLPEEVISHHQLYVTPATPAVVQLASGRTPHQLYQEGVSWIWVSEETLNHQEEKWLKPEEFLTKTLAYPTNPVPGKIVSDCSEQANTLVSLLRASGVPATHVRAVMGKVNFEGQVGGHVWVQIYQDEVWIDLDPTSGSYWDDEKRTLVQSSGLPWNYFKFFPFPVIETWVYYNDRYFYDLETGKGNPPTHWY